MSVTLANDNTIQIGKHTFTSRLMVGTGKYASNEEMVAALDASGAEVVTVAVRRIDLNRTGDSILNHIDLSRYSLLPNTAGCYTVEDTLRTARLGREALDTDLIKLEVLGDEKTLFPDNEATLEAARILVKEGFTIMPYTSDDPIMARKLEDIGCAAVMPLASPIGSGLGITNPYNISIILETVKVPVIIDAGVGTASDAALAMELGCDGVLMNTAIATAKDPVKMARAMRLGIESGRLARAAGRMPKKLYGAASSPTAGMLT